jgi:hypothetical protein
MHSRCLAFFLFKFGGGGGGSGFFFHLSLVPNVLSVSSLLVPNGFPICSPSSQCVPQRVLHSTSFLSYMVWQMLSSFHLFKVGQMGGTR